MARINLLPWREELRAERKRQFFGILGLAAVVGVLVAILVHMTFQSKITNQQGRNSFLKTEISQLDIKIREIEKLEKQREELLNKMQIVQSLQQSRPLVVRLFDELVRQIPTGVHLTDFTRKGKKLALIGKSESTPRISAFMRNIEKSKWIAKADVSGIKADKKGNVASTIFTMTAQQVGLKKTGGKKKGGKKQ
ncbi:MAG: PilN domain-containing protein [Gammaproteobacteria bacterium]|nr:PilN domain-containing protein [Gammaproteobacteria bacterium]